MTALRSPFNSSYPLKEKEAFRTLVDMHPGISILVRQILSYTRLPEKEHPEAQILLTLESRAFFDLRNPKKSYMEHEFVNPEGPK